LRPHAFAANALSWAAQIRAEGAVSGPYPAATTAPIHEHDIAAVAMRALTSDGHAGAVYELTGPETLTQADEARIIGEDPGRPVRGLATPPEPARQRRRGRGGPATAVDEILKAQADLVTTPGPLTTTVKRVTGTPARTFREWAYDHADRFQDTMRA